MRSVLVRTYSDLAVKPMTCDIRLRLGFGSRKDDAESAPPRDHHGEIVFIDLENLNGGWGMFGQCFLNCAAIRRYEFTFFVVLLLLLNALEYLTLHEGSSCFPQSMSFLTVVESCVL